MTCGKSRWLESLLFQKLFFFFTVLTDALDDTASYCADDMGWKCFSLLEVWTSSVFKCNGPGINMFRMLKGSTSSAAVSWVCVMFKHHKQASGDQQLRRCNNTTSPPAEGVVKHLISALHKQRDGWGSVIQRSLISPHPQRTARPAC